MGYDIYVAVMVTLVFVLLFSAAWIWMSRYEEAKKELTEAKGRLKAAREDATKWREAAERLAEYIEGRKA